MPSHLRAMVPAPPFDPLLLLLAALAVDAAAGEMRFLLPGRLHPIALLGRLIASLDRRLNRDTRGPAARRMRGGFVVIVVAGLAALAGWLLLSWTRTLSWGWAIEVLAIAIMLAQRSLYDHVAAVRRALDQGGLAAGRAAVRHIVGRDPESLDAHGVARAAIESLAENFSDGVAAPVFWYVIAGLPGLFACKAINTLDSMLGHRTPRHLDFGHWAARVDTAMNFIPARLSALVLSIAALFTPTADPRAALRIVARDARKHRSVNAGWPEAATAGALALALAGPRRYGGTVVDDPWIGDGRARAVSQDIGRALYLYVAACLVLAALIAGLAVARGA